VSTLLAAADDLKGVLGLGLRRRRGWRREVREDREEVDRLEAEAISPARRSNPWPPDSHRASRAVKVDRVTVELGHDGGDRRTFDR
jgi:hypothetical protein